MTWGHYEDVANNLVFVLVMAAWNLLALDLLQQLKRQKLRKQRREEWKS
jgi:hypothetical protein